MSFNANDPESMYRELEISPPPLKLKKRVLQAIQDENRTSSLVGEDVTGGGRGFLPPLLRAVLAAAAVLLLCFGGYLLKTRLGQKGRSPEQPRQEAADISAKDKFYVLRTEPDTHTLMAQEFRDFTVKYCQVGSEIAGFILTDVEDDAFFLQDAGGCIVRREVNAWNKESLTILGKEVHTLQARHQAGRMDSSDLDRLGAIARYGDLSAIGVLKQIAARRGDPHMQQAKRMLAGSNPEALAGLITLARTKTGKAQHRKHVLQTLANLKTIQGSIILREIAMDAADPCRAFAIQMLAAAGCQDALPV
ncbi:hypothetical protein ACFL54_05065, partial [Planctomycetota bacterium]